MSLSRYETSTFHWIGLRGTCDSSGCQSFNWLVDEGGQFQNWAHGYPQSNSHSNSPCVHSYLSASRSWYNSACSMQLRAICEFIDDCHPDNPCNVGDVCQSVAYERGHTCVPRDSANECLSEPCQNDATCIDILGNYTCVCTQDWEGRNCEKKQARLHCRRNTMWLWSMQQGVC